MTKRGATINFQSTEALLEADSSDVGRNRPEEGVTYIAFGRTHYVMALFSASSFRRTNPGRGVRIVTDIHIPLDQAFEDFDPTTDSSCFVQSSAERNRAFKTSANRYSPFPRTLLLDADTVVLQDLDLPFRLLNHADLLLKPDPKGQNRDWQREEWVLDLGVLGDIPSWNGGVVFFRRSTVTDEFFDSWHSGLLERGSEFDQPSLVEAIITSSARVLPLDERWNSPTSRFRKSGERSGPTRILHYMREMPRWVRDGVLEVDARLSGLGFFDGPSPVRDELEVREREPRRPKTRLAGRIRRRVGRPRAGLRPEIEANETESVG